MLIFKEEGKPEDPEKNPRGKEGTNKQLETTTDWDHSENSKG
jgi:hypothetical protein